MRTRLIERLQQQGLRRTAHREQVCHILDEALDQPCADDIHHRLRARGSRISLGSIYRILDGFVRAGLLRRLHLGGPRMRYEIVGPDRHDHIVDMRTGAVEAFRHDALQCRLRKIAADAGYELIDYELTLHGMDQRKL
ncbi:MAG: Fur family transcriptional regulator [Pseudomonadota bacterium]